MSDAPLAIVGAVGLIRAVGDHRLYSEYKVSSSIQTELYEKKNDRERDRGRKREKRKGIARWREIARAIERMQNRVYSDEFNLRVRKDEIVSAIVYACTTREYIPENAGHRSSSHRASSCYQGKNRAALKGDIPAIWKDVRSLEYTRISLFLFLSIFETVGCPRSILKCDIPRDDEI